jgi:hypothetical protein
LIASAAKLHTEPAQPSKMQHACLNETVSHQKNATKRPIDLPHLPIAPKTEKSAADPPPTLLCKLLNIGSEQASSEQTTFPQQNSGHLLTKKNAAWQQEENTLTNTITHENTSLQL